MKIVGTLVVVVGLSLSGITRAAEVDVTVANPPGTGTVVVLLYNSADAFGDLREPLQLKRFSAGEKEPVRFEGLAAGTYAVMVFHDENGNSELDQNFMGIPREPLGFSQRYWAKGAPQFSGAAFTVDEGSSIPVDVELKKIFGRKGLIGVGVGAIAQSSPYRGSDSAQFLAIPAVTYIGERVQILGPGGQVGLTTWKGVRLAATARYRLGAYDEEDSDFLEGMGDRKDSLFCGLALQGALPAGVRISAGYEHDVLDRVGGGYGRLGLRRGFQYGRYSVVPSVGVNWLTTELAGHEYGVTAEEARDGREEYAPGDTINIEPGLGLSAEWFGSWRLIVNGSVEFLSSDLRDSPIVDQSQIFRFFGAVNYTF